MLLDDDISAGQLHAAATQQAKGYYPYSILHKISSFVHHFSPSPSTTNTNTNNNQSSLQDQKLDSATAIIKESETRTKDQFLKRILIVDDEPDVSLTFRVGLDSYYDEDDKRRFEIYTYNNPIEAALNFKPNFYDLLLTDIFMPKMNGFELCQKIIEIDTNIRVCFMSAAEVNIEALREVYPKVSFGCFIKKPVTIEYLVERLGAELD